MRGPCLALLTAALVAGCATSGPSSRPVSDTRAGTEYRRCSNDDPDRYAWFCILGQIVYSAIGAFQAAPNPGSR